MADWQPYREPFRVTLTRTLSIALVAGAAVALPAGGIQRWLSFLTSMIHRFSPA